MLSSPSWNDWKSYEMVLRYAHLAPDHLSHAAARIERTLEIVEQNSTKTLRSVDEKMDVKAQVFEKYGAPGTIRTCDRLVRSQVLYPAELQAR